MLPPKLLLDIIVYCFLISFPFFYGWVLYTTVFNNSETSASLKKLSGTTIFITILFCDFSLFGYRQYALFTLGIFLAFHFAMFPLAKISNIYWAD